MSDKFRFPTVTAVVIANMIGTGVFTSLGFQLLEIRSGFVILTLWALGGLIALCGAMTYAELGAALPRSGGEYNFLTEICHPAAGIVAGWTLAYVLVTRPVEALFGLGVIASGLPVRAGPTRSLCMAARHVICCKLSRTDPGLTLIAMPGRGCVAHGHRRR